MARTWQINGESMVSVKGNQSTAIASLTQLGLSDGPIPVSVELKTKDIMVDAWGGGEAPADVQVMGAIANLRISLVHWDKAVLQTCIQESMGGTTEGQVPRTGQVMGNGLARFAAGNHYLGLNILSPVGNTPWRFYYAQMIGTPFEWPLGTEKTILVTNWRAIAYAADPWGAGVGSTGAPLYDHVLDV